MWVDSIYIIKILSESEVYLLQKNQNCWRPVTATNNNGKYAKLWMERTREANDNTQFKTIKLSISKMSTFTEKKEKKNTYKTLFMCVDDNFKHWKPNLLQEVV